jgi:outer membrane protein OmpA-like peptidoglycan-associated protein
VRGGRPLDERTRTAFESRFAYNFASVRVHTDARADAAARSADALAYTVGSDLVFRHGAFSPHTAGGSKLLAHELAHVAHEPADGAIHRKRPGGGGDDPAERRAEMAADRVTARPPAIEALMSRVRGSAALLRAELAASPALGAVIEDYFLTGGDSALSDLLSRAFPPPKATATEREKGPRRATASEKEKDPTDPTLPLPAARADTKVLTKGTMTWNLQAVDHSNARIDLDFLPNPDKVDAKNVSFVQTILNTLGTNPLYPGASVADTVGNKATYSPFEETTEKRRVDHVAARENDPFYGAEWDNSSTPKKWKNESGGTVVGGSSTAMAKASDAMTPGGWMGRLVKKTVRAAAASPAKMNDNPGTAMGRLGKGETTKQFETVPVVLETREPLGAIKWGYKIADTANAPLELTGATKADVTETPSATWSAALEKFYSAKFVTLDEFDQDQWDLKPVHKTQLDGIATRMKATAGLKAELGGAADLKDADPAGVAQKRADAARAYLIAKGIGAGRLTTQAYGSDWAKVATTAGAAEPKNRRVQIWVK